MTTGARVAALYRYPVKSSAAQSLRRVTVEGRGLMHDRRWMIVDDAGDFITGRQEPRLVQLTALPTNRALTLRAPGCETLRVAVPSNLAARCPVTVWGDRVDAADCGDAAADWLSTWLGRATRLVYMDCTAQRVIDPQYGAANDTVSFADGYPLLLISQAALGSLAERAGRTFDMRRFRPNIVVDGVGPHAEDGWRRLRIASIEFNVVKTCTRCRFTTVDPDTATRDPDGEPLRTLARYRRADDGIGFGQNLIPRSMGTLRVGDAVTVLA